MRNPGFSQDLTGLAPAVQLRLRVAIGLQTLIVKSRLLTGENSVRIRGNPPLQCSRSSKYQSGRLRTARLQVRVLPGSTIYGRVPTRRVSPTTRDAPLRTERVLADCHRGGPQFATAKILIWGIHFVAGLGSQIPHAAPIGLSRDRALRISARR
jgi:hypothetical protein